MTPAARLLADYGITGTDAVVAELQDSKAAMLSWAGPRGRFSMDDLEAVLQGHGETLSSWVRDCEIHGFEAVYDAQAVLTWLGY